jgi:sugar lactone lactonase YvrE
MGHFRKGISVILCFVFTAVIGGDGSVWGEEEIAKTSFKARYVADFKADTTQSIGLNQPADVVADGEGHVYVADTINSRILVFNEGGKTVNTFGKEGNGPGRLSAPMALTVDTERDRVYVADSSNYRIQIFKMNGEFVETIDLNKDMATSERKVRPIGIAVNSKGNIYISDADNNFIRIYSSDGTMINKFGGFGNNDGQFAIPVGLAIDNQDRVYAVDMNNSRFQIFDESGKFISKIGERGDVKGNFMRPKDIWVDENGLIYVSDGATLVIQVFDPHGKLIGVVGSEKDVNLQFASPFGLSVANKNLYVMDRWRNSIRVYEISY